MAKVDDAAGTLTAGDPKTVFRPNQACAVAHTGIFDQAVFVALAQGYRLTSDDAAVHRGDLCRHNAQVGPGVAVAPPPTPRGPPHTLNARSGMPRTRQVVDDAQGPPDVAQSWRVLAALLDANDMLEAAVPVVPADGHDADAGKAVVPRRRRSSALDWIGPSSSLLADPFEGAVKERGLIRGRGWDVKARERV